MLAREKKRAGVSLLIGLAAGSIIFGVQYLGIVRAERHLRDLEQKCGRVHIDISAIGADPEFQKAPPDEKIARLKAIFGKDPDFAKASPKYQMAELHQLFPETVSSAPAPAAVSTATPVTDPLIGKATAKADGRYDLGGKRYIVKGGKITGTEAADTSRTKPTSKERGVYKIFDPNDFIPAEPVTHWDFVCSGADLSGVSDEQLHSGTRRELRDAYHSLSDKRDQLGSWPAGVLVVFLLPLVWSFLLDRLREISAAISGRDKN